MNNFIFDFDGTLVDSMPTFIWATLKILHEHQVSYSDDIIKIITPLGFKGTAEYFIELGVKKPVEDIVNDMKTYMFDKYLNDIPAKNGVINVLTELKHRGVCLNVLTASPHITLDACLKRLGIYHLFDNVWSCDDFNTTKANPEIYKLAAQRIGSKVQDVLFLDDNLNANLTAKTAGMMVCGVYDKSSDDYTEQIKAATDFYIYDFYELLGLPIF